MLGTLLRPSAVAVGDLVQARDPSGFWFNARIIRKAGRGHSTSAIVHYIGFGMKHDEKFTARKEGLRVRLSAAALRAEREAMLDEKVVEHFGGRTDGRRNDGTWEIERILKVRTRGGRQQYLVRWMGWGAPGDDTWEDENLSAEIIEEYEEEQAEIDKAKLQQPPPVPFAIELAEAETEAVRELRIADAEELLADIANEVKEKLKHQLAPEAEKKLYVLKPVSAPIFYAMRETLARWAEEAQPARPVETVVEKIMTFRGGKKPVNTFGVLDVAIVNRLLGAGAFKIQDTKNGAAIKVVAPFEFFLKARKDELTGELLPVKELVIKGHIATLVPNHEFSDEPRFRLDKAVGGIAHHLVA
jgi:hypothetical protein